MFGECKHCKKDYNKNHTPNNYHCPNYYEVNMIVRTVVDGGIEKITINKPIKEVKKQDKILV
jgi:hypothetical protein